MEIIQSNMGCEISRASSKEIIEFSKTNPKLKIYLKYRDNQKINSFYYLKRTDQYKVFRGFVSEIINKDKFIQEIEENVIFG